jgi:hypothetical protein
MHTFLEGHNTNAQYVGRACPSDPTFHPLISQQNYHAATLKISEDLDCIYPLYEKARSVK